MWILHWILVTAAVGSALGSRRLEAILQSLDSSAHAAYRIVRPQLVDDAGHVVSGIRGRRSAEDRLHYQLPLPHGPAVHVTLEPNRRLIGPGFAIERWGNDSKASVQTPNCFFLGSVRNVTGRSTVALSTCSGLRGMVRLEDDDYLVEPLEGGGEDRAHVVYRRSALRRGSSLCATKDSSWERTRKGTQRKKRSVSRERNVETLVVADSTMVEYYSNEDIETYLLTVLNMVSSLYHDASIGNAINVVLVRMIILDKSKELEINASSADSALKSFCRWQRFVNPLDENHPNHHDVAILITRYKMCIRNGEPCNTLGLAEVAGMCQPQRSCNVNEDSGLTLAYTIAHELGHNFGMSHDGPQNGCQHVPGERQHVMAPQLSADTSPVVWSDCSREEITRFLDRDWGRCLDDEPQSHYAFPQLPPGAMYDAHHQCRLQYGPEAEHCPGIEEVCQTLWCRLDSKCITKMEPAAEGTVCGKNKWCHLGNCTEIGDRPAAIDGGWGPWSPWSTCTRSCGGGVAFSERHCDNPMPSNGGRYCIGERKRYKLCNTEQACPEGSPSFRAVQCSNFNNIPHKGELFNWSPVSSSATPCQLHCKPDGKFFSVMLQESVVDGTPCSPGSRDVCINGKCKRVACDWGIESSAQEDRCGICHGDGTQCITVRKEFTQKQGLGYIEVGKIPKGARNIHIEEVAQSSNYVAIQGAADGEFFLNGEWFIQWSGEYAAAGTTLFYQRDGEKEVVHAPGPIKGDLLLYVSSAKCMEKEAGLVEDTYCNATHKPPAESRPCNKHPCPARWWTGPWQPCSATCGGVRHRTVLCVRSRGMNEQLALMDDSCAAQTRPTETEPCSGHPRCPEDAPQWNVGNWTEDCSSDPCGNQTREVTCSHDACDPNTRPSDTRVCNSVECGVWLVGNWSQCSESCGGGQQFREVTCSQGVLCHIASRPVAVQECNNLPCGDTVNENASQPNLTSSANVVLSSPQPAVTSSSVLHKVNDRPTETVVDMKPNFILDIPDDFWNVTGAPRRTVVLEDARYAWRASKWTKCSRACGGGERRRKVKCVDKVTQKEVPEDLCYLHTQHLKPPNRSLCNIDLCLEWQTTEWSKCSAKCGPGQKQREVTCPMHNRCDLAKRPLSTTTCNRGPCFAWVAGPWSQCSVSCGIGTQVRHVKCANQHTLEQFPVATCSRVPRPPREQACGGELCPQDPSEKQAELKDCRDSPQHACPVLRHTCARSRYVRVHCCRTCRRREVVP
ncbi:A disintegrin and metalloproteinase with thrombospondin motifs 7-like isoform X2 [Ornithodoros turicata]|uniref:A disintegrin and metalloproteinase with thrombospondin motifs 7-like isoform X2 n=1 Tax=Ornithodoros turicata TaxID=34597 RepID=UPI0031388126